jgi:hypothetical protein
MKTIPTLLAAAAIAVGGTMVIAAPVAYACPPGSTVLPPDISPPGTPPWIMPLKCGPAPGQPVAAPAPPPAAPPSNAAENLLGPMKNLLNGQPPPAAPPAASPPAGQPGYVTAQPCDGCGPAGFAAVPAAPPPAPAAPPAPPAANPAVPPGAPAGDALLPGLAGKVPPAAPGDNGLPFSPPFPPAPEAPPIPMVKDGSGDMLPLDALQHSFCDEHPFGGYDACAAEVAQNPQQYGTPPGYVPPPPPEQPLPYIGH